ncbi:MAG: hypothetical protein ICV73_23510 [Acetobacteraceae bacterium]|nr:hypothetical protein [Acetobacteraceae bacterium]
MRRHGTTDEGQGGLAAAAERYRAAFGKEVPCLYWVTGEATPVAVAMLDHAVAVRRPLGSGQIAAARGGARQDRRKGRLPLELGKLC